MGARRAATPPSLTPLRRVRAEGALPVVLSSESLPGPGSDVPHSSAASDASPPPDVVEAGDAARVRGSLSPLSERGPDPLRTSACKAEVNAGARLSDDALPASLALYFDASRGAVSDSRNPSPPSSLAPSNARCADVKSKSYSLLAMTAGYSASNSACAVASTSYLRKRASSAPREAKGWELSNRTVASRPNPRDSANGPPGWGKSVTSSHFPWMCVSCRFRHVDAGVAIRTSAHECRRWAVGSRPALLCEAAQTMQTPCT